MKAVIRKLAARHAGVTRIYEGARHAYHHVRKLAYFVSDARTVFRHMHWRPAARHRYWALSAELLFHYHKLEKGLCMPGEKRFFGYDPARATLELLTLWRQQGYSLNDPIYLGAIETVRAYRARIEQTPPEQGLRLMGALEAELAENPLVQYELSTPRAQRDVVPEDAREVFFTLMQARRSIRSFSAQAVAPNSIARAISSAQLSPSACNRQPARVHCYTQRSQIDAMLALQNGNRGFGHTAPVLLVLTTDATGYFDASERHAPYIDGGMFAMSLILALQAEGLSSCCLNWGVAPAEDRAAHHTGNIPESEQIVMFVVVGYPEPAARAPRSPRRALPTVFIQH